MSEQLREGDIISIDNVPAIAGYKFRVCETRADGAVRLRPAEGESGAAFNDAAGEFWIVPPAVNR